ncbi:M48 family metalloprotease [Actinomadura geliboluensis]|uniref:M48 family metalloprotease n=1 Tax=Actinomadura geliboluensis TaxID=882440 RepID=UPI003718A0CB
MHELYVAKDAHKAGKRRILIVPVAHLAIGIGVGTAARAALSPAVASTVTTAAAALIAGWTVSSVYRTFRNGSLRNVDWATAPVYEQNLTSGLHPDTRAVLARAQRQILQRSPAASRVHLYSPDQLPEHDCTLDTTGCDCARMRVNATVMPSRRHPVLVVGDRLLDQPAALAYVLAHEVNHVRRPWPLVYGLILVIMMAGWLGMGLVLPWRTLVVVAPVVWAATMTMSWVNELAADYAARPTGPDAARAYWTMLRAARPTPTGWARLTGAVMAVLTPTHPPITLRAALADRIAHRALP